VRAVVARSRLGESQASRSFGAAITVQTPDRSLCLVVCRNRPELAVLDAGGQVVTRLSAERVLALLRWEGLQRLWADPRVVAAGSVSIDAQRFARFCALAGIDDAGRDSETAEGAHRARKG
jgi:hypothetical protein